MTEPLTLVFKDDEHRDYALVIASMAQVRNKPKGVDRTVLVDRETRIYNDRLWARHDREDQIRREALAETAALFDNSVPVPRKGFFRRLFG